MSIAILLLLSIIKPLPPRLTNYTCCIKMEFNCNSNFVLHHAFQKFWLLSSVKIGVFLWNFLQKKQNTVTREKKEIELIARGRHDPCVVPRGIGFPSFFLICPRFVFIVFFFFSVIPYLQAFATAFFNDGYVPWELWWISYIHCEIVLRIFDLHPFFAYLLVLHFQTISN